jgi:type II secretory pathway pseudopilin PulG
MQRRESRQSGFGVVEVLAVIAVVAVLGASGWFVYQHNQPKKTEAAQNTGQTTIRQTTKPTPTPTTNYISIPEWGVRAPYSGNLKLKYTMSSDGTGASFSSDELTALSNKCADNGGGIVRWSQDDTSSRPAYESNQEADNYLSGKPSTSTYAHIGQYYYGFVHSQSGCGDINSTATLQSQTNDAVKALVPNLEKIPN